MSQDALRLTTYFGERSRMKGRLLADELLDIHARHGVRASVLLRGVQGFGAKHRLRTDRLLTLSEDLPLVSVTVDSGERIHGLFDEMSAIGSEGLIALERAYLREPQAKQVELSDGGDGEGMKLTLYVGRHERVNGSPAFAAICQALRDCGVAGATVLLGVDGVRHGERQRARFFASNANVPLMVVSVGDEQPVEDALSHLQRMLIEPLFTIERVRVCKRDGVLLRPPHDALPTEDHGELRQKLTVITSEAARHENRSVYIELVRRLRMANAAGATSLRGIWGFHGDHPPHGDRLLSIRRHVPVLTEVIDTPQRIATLFPIVDELTRQRGLVTSELVPTTSTLNEALAYRSPPRDAGL
jgi:PII-like signaling protein